MTRHLGHESMIRLDGFDGRIIALYARDMTTREIRGEAYSASVRQAEIHADATALAGSERASFITGAVYQCDGGVIRSNV